MLCYVSLNFKFLEPTPGLVHHDYDRVDVEWKSLIFMAIMSERDQVLVGSVMAAKPAPAESHQI